MNTLSNAVWHYIYEQCEGAVDFKQLKGLLALYVSAGLMDETRAQKIERKLRHISPRGWMWGDEAQNFIENEIEGYED